MDGPGGESRGTDGNAWMSVLIKNGRIVTAADDYEADVFIQEETVTLIGRDLVLPADRVIDAAGKLVIPGGVDPHTHHQMPFGGTETSRYLRDRHPGRRPRRDHVHRRLRDPDPGHLHHRVPGRLAREGGGQDRDRLRVPHESSPTCRTTGCRRCAGSPMKE